MSDREIEMATECHQNEKSVFKESSDTKNTKKILARFTVCRGYSVNPYVRSSARIDLNYSKPQSVAEHMFLSLL